MRIERLIDSGIFIAKITDIIRRRSRSNRAFIQAITDKSDVDDAIAVLNSVVFKILLREEVVVVFVFSLIILFLRSYRN